MPGIFPLLAPICPDMLTIFCAQFRECVRDLSKQQKIQHLVLCNNVFPIYEGHLESSGNSGISQSQKQDPVHLSYQCKGIYLFK